MPLDPPPPLPQRLAPSVLGDSLVLENISILLTVFIHLQGALGYKTHPKLSKTIVTSKQNQNFT